MLDGHPVVFASRTAGRVIWVLGSACPGGHEPLRVAPDVLDRVLLQAGHGEYCPELYPTRQAWRAATRFAPVLASWVTRRGKLQLQLRFRRGKCPVGESVAADAALTTASWQCAREGHLDWLAGRG